MKNSRFFSRTLLILIAIGIVIGLSVRAKAQNVEGIIPYLEERFRQESIPVKEITILSQSPLRLQIIIQGNGTWVTPDDDSNLRKLDRDIFIFARQQGYFVDRYVRILVDPQGKHLDYLDQVSPFDSIPVNVSPSNLADAITLQMAKEKINLLVDKYDLHKISITKVDVSSSDGFQTLTLQLQVPSLEEAKKALALTAPMYPLIKEINTQGAQIVMYKVLAQDQEGNHLIDYYFDLQLMHESWRTDNRLDTSGMFPEPAPVP